MIVAGLGPLPLKQAQVTASCHLGFAGVLALLVCLVISAWLLVELS